MHAAVTKSTATKSYYSTLSTDELLPPINLADSLGWVQTQDLANEESLENWQLPSSNATTATQLPSVRRTTSGLQKLAFSSNMHSRTESNSSKPDHPVHPSERSAGVANAQRWRFNGNGQLVDSEAAAAEWDLADEIVRLNIGEAGGETVDRIRTPPKSKLVAAAVAQLNEASPLDTSSNTSVNSSPHPSDHQIGISHSRGSSTGSSSQDSALSASSNTLLVQSHAPLKVNNEPKERPHSFSGGLSSADLRRLQEVGEPVPEAVERQNPQQQWSSLQYRETIGPNDKQFPPEQLSYPSLANQPTVLRPQQQPQHYDYRSGPPPAAHVTSRDELQIDYNIQQRNFNPLPQGSGVGAPRVAPPAFVAGRPNNTVSVLPYRQGPGGFPQQLPAQATLGYPTHASHLSLGNVGNSQQLYDMMLPLEGHHPAVTRVQQQHNVFRAGHHHSASDPSAIRDAATLALITNMQGYPPSMFPGTMPPPSMPIYPSQFYGTQETYPGPDVATAQAMAARLQAQYTGSYGAVPQNLGLDGGLPSPSSVGSQNGPSANNRKLGLYKTELCRSWEEKGTCRYSTKCQFAHGEEELRKVARHPKYKTEICRTFWVSGSCPYGKRCCFIHTELPATGAVNGTGAVSATDNAPPQHRPDGRARSLSTNSDPNDASVSLLARISAKRPQEQSNGNNVSTPIDMTSSNGFQFNTRPPTGSLRVDTSALDGASMKQNKSAYPSFASNGILLPAPEHITAKSPAPVTAGPDLGRHNNSRLEIVGYNHQLRLNKSTTSSNSSVRHSFNGTEVDLNFSPPPPSVSNHASYAMSSAENNSSPAHTPRANGHVRAGSAGNWGSFSRSSHLGPSPYSHSSSPGDGINSPWSTTDLAVGSSRLNEKAWV